MVHRLYCGAWAFSCCGTWASLIVEHRSRVHGFSSCGTLASLVVVHELSSCGVLA